METLLNPKTENRQAESFSPLRICFVCTGNTCRSPMAAAVANAFAKQELKGVPKEFQDRTSPRLQAASAGLFANEGEPIAINAVKALEKADISPCQESDYHLHTAHTLTEKEAERFDWIVGLSGSHQMQLLLQYPNLAKKIIGMPTPIADPYGKDEKTYALCLQEIIAGVKKLFFDDMREEKK